MISFIRKIVRSKRNSVFLASVVFCALYGSTVYATLPNIGELAVKDDRNKILKYLSSDVPSLCNCVDYQKMQFFCMDVVSCSDNSRTTYTVKFTPVTADSNREITDFDWISLPEKVQHNFIHGDNVCKFLDSDIDQPLTSTPISTFTVYFLERFSVPGKLIQWTIPSAFIRSKFPSSCMNEDLIGGLWYIEVTYIPSTCTLLKGYHYVVSDAKIVIPE